MATQIDNEMASLHLVRSLLEERGFYRNNATTLRAFLASTDGLFPDRMHSAMKVKVPLMAECHLKHPRFTKVDFAILPSHGQAILMAISSQSSGGSADAKLEFSAQSLMATRMPSVMFVRGEITIKHIRQKGYRPSVIYPFWERVRWQSADSLLLFRKSPSFVKWIEDGLPVGGNGQSWQRIFLKYCDLEP